MKIKNYILLLFFSLSYMVLTGFTAIDTNGMNETQWHGSQLQNSSTTITLPASALKRTSDGRLVLNLPGGSDGGGWDDWKKNRPFFMGESLVQVSDGESLFGGILESIRQTLESPMSREEIRQQQEYLDALEIELEAYRRQQEAEAIAQQLGVQGETTIFFWNHPGYQESHPAHAGKEQVYTVPGILEAPKKGGSGGTAPANTGSSSKKGGEGVSSGGSGIEWAGTDPGGGASGGGGGKKTPESNWAKEREDTKIGLHLVAKELDDGTRLEAYVTDSLYCPVCLDLIDSSAAQCVGCSNSDGGQCEKQCEGCEAVFCWEHLNQVNICPCCMHSVNDNTCNKVAKARELRNIKWTCANCGKVATGSEMEGHNLQCVKRSLVRCRHEGCEADVLKQNLREHESSCDYRLVDFGCFQIPCWQKMLIESVKAPDNPGRENAEAQAAEVSVGILCELILTLPPREAAVDCAWGCGYQEQSQKELQRHYVNCPRVLEKCSYCGSSQERRCMSSHMSACYERPVDCPRNCGVMGLVARQLGEHAKTCEMRPAACEYCANEFAQKTLENHQSKCALKPTRCGGCFSGMTIGELTEHAKSCALMQARFQLGDLLLSRQPGTENAVYKPEGDSDDEVYLILPAKHILEAVKKSKSRCFLCDQNIKFTWDGSRYNTRFSSYYGFCLRPVLQQEQKYHVAANIDILSDSSQQLARMQTYFHQCNVICINHSSNEGEAKLYNAASLEGYKGDYCAIRICKIRR